MTQALIVVDLQKDVLADQGTYDPDGVVRRTNVVVAKAREARVPVIWVMHSSDDLAQDTPGWQLADELVPLESEPIVHKLYGDSFEETNLMDLLGDVKHVAICGAQTDQCVRSTIQGAISRGYNVTLISDAHTCGEFPAEYTGGELIKSLTKINFMNAIVAWGLRYPGRHGATATAAEVSFNQ